jgi:hypothetical protein
MKNIKILFTLFLVVLFFQSSSFLSNDSMLLKDAIKKGLVSVEAISNGGHSGKCISLNIQSKTKKELQLIIEPGSVFNSDNSGEQDIFILDEQKILVRGNQRVSKPIIGFCCQMSNSSPDEGSTSSYETSKNEKLIKLAKFMNKKRFSESICQEAVWAVSDGNGVSGIYDPENPKVAALRKTICEITGEKDTWYNSKARYTLDENLNIVKTPVSISSAFTANIDKGGEIHYEVLDAEGKNTSMSNLKGRLPSAGEYNLKFNLTVEGWEKGNYRVQLIFEGTVLHEKAFVIG